MIKKVDYKYIFLIFLITGCDDSEKRAGQQQKEAADRALQAQQAVIESLKRCDALTAHPRDPGRYATGVSDDQLAPGSAIEACETAVKLNPNTPRALFQLGRAYWSAQRDKDAVAAFVQAANFGYAPAMKYIGDAYLEGRGLPSGQQQDTHTALIWYRKAAAGEQGFPDARKAVIETEDAIKEEIEARKRVQNELQKQAEQAERNKFDPSIFQNPKYITALYNNDLNSIKMTLPFLMYTNALVGKLGGEEILFVDSHCKPLTTSLTSITILLGELVTLAKSSDLGQAIGNFLSGALTSDQGTRDAVTLVNRYGCNDSDTTKNSEVTKIIMRNIVIKYKNSGEIDTLGSTTYTVSENNNTNKTSSFKNGVTDRKTWEDWFSKLTIGDYRSGVFYWSSKRNDKPQVSCHNQNNESYGDFTQGCLDAKTFLTKVDQNRASYPDYKKGFASFTPTALGNSTKCSVIGIKPDDPDGGLVIHETAERRSPTIGEIPYNGRGVKNIDCTCDGSAKKTLCHVNYDGTDGWVSGKYLFPD